MVASRRRRGWAGPAMGVGHHESGSTKVRFDLEILDKNGRKFIIKNIGA
jgi:hypothetical protein